MDNIKVLLINPSDKFRIRLPGYSEAHYNIHEFNPPLGLMYIKSYLMHVNRGAKVKLFNFQIPEKPTYNDFLKFLINFKPDVIGITVSSFFWYDVCKLIRLIKNVIPKVIIIGGGAHMWVYPEQSLVTGNFDIIVQGEGEITFAELIDCIENKKDIKNIKGIIYKKNNTIIETQKRLVEMNPDKFPFPDRSDILINQYNNPLNKNHPTAVIITGRGCPHKCKFCNNNNRVYRKRLINKIIDEIIECKKMGYNSIDFTDDNFCQSRKHVEALCLEMIKGKINMPWVCRGRVDGVDRELIKLMKMAGCERIHFGIESGNQKYLDWSGKGINLEQSRKAMSYAKEFQISTIAYLIVGFPGETIYEAKKTISFGFELDADYVLLNALIPFPGSKLFEEATKDPEYDSEYILNFIKKPFPDLILKPWPTGMTETEIFYLQRKSYLKYYFRPRIILRHICQLKSYQEILTKSWLAFKLMINLSSKTD